MGNTSFCKCLSTSITFGSSDPYKSSLNPKNSGDVLEFVKNKKNDIPPNNKPKPRPITLNDFKIERILGKGSFGKVMLVKHKETDKIFAMKIIRKEEVIKKNQVENIMLERNILKESEHPFVIKLRYAFQNEAKIFFVMDYLRGGELFYHLRQRKTFKEDVAAFYSAQVVLALEYLHISLKIVYRDLKPENILLDEDGNIKLTDFGLATNNKRFSYSFCGTPEYLAPEILLEVGHSNPVDWWSLGCLIFEMLAGKPPFRSQSREELFKLIIESEHVFPEHFSPEAQSLINKLLSKNPVNRPKIQEIKNHPFFKKIDWNAIERKKVAPPIKPVFASPEDASYFPAEPKFDETPNENKIELKYQEHFRNLTYKYMALPVPETEEEYERSSSLPKK